MLHDYINQSFIYLMAGRPIYKVSKQLDSAGALVLTKELVHAQGTWVTVHNPAKPGYDLVIEGEQVKLSQIADHSMESAADHLLKGEAAYASPYVLNQFCLQINQAGDCEQKCIAGCAGSVLLS